MAIKTLQAGTGGSFVSASPIPVSYTHLSPDNEEDYTSVKKDIEFYGKDRERFCYIQSNGIFELNNAFFGIEDHLCWTALYPEELKEL